MTMRSTGLDVALAAWVLLVGTVFVAPFLCRANGWVELELVARYVYLGVLTAGLIGLALRVLRIVKR